MKGGIFKMNTRIALWAVIGVLFVATIYLTFKTGDVSAAQSSAQTTVVAVKSAATSSNAMVGGC